MFTSPTSIPHFQSREYEARLRSESTLEYVCEREAFLVLRRLNNGLFSWQAFRWGTMLDERYARSTFLWLRELYPAIAEGEDDEVPYYIDLARITDADWAHMKLSAS